MIVLEHVRCFFYGLIFLCLVLPNNAFSSIDKPWSKGDLESEILSNLVINGDLQHQRLENDLRSSIEDVVAPCWRVSKSDIGDVVYSKSSLKFIEEYAPTLIFVRAARYYFNGTEGLINVVVKGEFEDEMDYVFYFNSCDIGCEQKKVKLEHFGNELRGAFDAPESEKYILDFVFDIKSGINEISSLKVSGAGYFTGNYTERDYKAKDICYKPPELISEEVNKYDLMWLGFVTFIFGMSIVFLLRGDYIFPAFLIFVFTITNVIGIWVLYYGGSEYRLAQRIIERDLLVDMMSINMVLLLVSFVSYYFVFRLSDKINFTVFNRYDNKIEFWVFVYVLISVFFVVGQYESIGSIIKSYIVAAADNKDYLNVSFIRQNIGLETFGLKSHFFSLLFIKLPVFVSLVLIWEFLSKKMVWPVLLIVLFQVVILLYNGEKAPALWFAYSVMFLCYMAFKKSSNSYKYCTPVILGNGFVLCVLLILPLIMMFDIPLLTSVADRVMLGSLTVAYYTLSIFPAESAFLNGNSISLLGMNFSGEKFDLLFYLWRMIHPELYYTTIEGTAIGAFWTEAYANFGYVGVFGSAIIIGLVLALSQFIIADKILPRSMQYPFYGWLLFHYVTFIESGISKFIVDFYMLGLVFCVLGLIVLEKCMSRLTRFIYDPE